MKRNFYLLLVISLITSCNFIRTNRFGNHPTSGIDQAVDLNEIALTKIASVGEYRDVLHQIDQGDLKSIEVASKLLINCDLDSISCDSMFYDFSDFMNIATSNYLENNVLISSQLANSTSKDTIDKIGEMLAPYGIGLVSSEGAWYLEPQSDYLLKNFGPKLSTAYREYLNIEVQEQKKRFAEDGSILIPLDSLASRIITHENFMALYPDFISGKLAHDKYCQYLGAYLAGMDNSRVFDNVTNLLKDEPRKSFESFIVRNPEKKSTEIVKAYLEMLGTTNFNYTDKVDSFLLAKVYQE
ncbi:MAG: hypothetical protein WCP85_26855 [Mariniphaga sp.]